MSSKEAKGKGKQTNANQKEGKRGWIEMQTGRVREESEEQRDDKCKERERKEKGQKGNKTF